ncbi:hypothetical protein [Acetobacter indonesiensis]
MKTHMTFAALAAKARAHVMTPKEKREQRINMIVGMSGRDSKVDYETARRFVDMVDSDQNAA